MTTENYYIIKRLQNLINKWLPWHVLFYFRVGENNTEKMYKLCYNMIVIGSMKVEDNCRFGLWE